MAMISSKTIFRVVFALCNWFLLISNGNSSSTISSSSTLPITIQPNTPLPPCNETEKHALLEFKRALHDPGNHLSSWSESDNEDCCAWNRVGCDNMTGRVVALELTGFSLGGEVSHALLQLESLNHLDLSENDFGGAPIPSFFGSMRSLTHFGLYRASFGGLIPPNLGNLSKLQYLKIGGGGYADDAGSSLYVEKLDWISHLSSLEYLYMHDVDLHKEVHWLQHTSMISSLSELYLIRCQLDNMSPSLKFVNFTSLAILSLTDNHFNHEIPNWLFNLNSSSSSGTSLLELSLGGNFLKGHIPSTIVEFHDLNYLSLSENQLSGQIPECLGQLKHLEALSLAYNSIDGPIPSSIGNLSSLVLLYLYANRLNGTLPSSIWLLPNLQHLLIGNNSLLVGTVSEAHLNKISKLKTLDVSSTSLIFKLVKPCSNWIPPFQLEYLWMSSCQLGPKFPTWLQTQTYLRYLDISNSGIVDVAPTWLWKWASHIHGRIDLSNNQISGNLSGVWLNTTGIWLYSNRFTGPLPAVSPNVIVLNMANNSLSGPISHFLCRFKLINGLTLSNLEALDLSNNGLYGQLPDDDQYYCWNSWPSLTHFKLGNNRLSGKIPDSISSLFLLKALRLQKNSFSGTVPSSLRNCSSLGLLDLSGNQLLGNIPNWIGELTSLKALSLRSNNFIGEIPSQICQLSSLIVLDLSDNELFGIIPRCFNNFSLMVTTETPDDLFTHLEYSLNELESLELTTVGRELEYKRILRYVRMIDLSSNNLSGSIPSDELTQLAGLRFLNLSRNHLMGRIPEKIGRMTSLLSLDLSRNHLSGEIPQSVAKLTFLNLLNLSYNQLQGRIPISTQLQSFDAYSYIGNPQLCGAPLTKNCTEEDVDQSPHSNSVDAIEDQNDEEGDEMPWFYVSMGLGFVAGFWGVCGALIFKNNWRYAYFQFVNDKGDWVHVAVAIRLNGFRRLLRGVLYKLVSK